MDNPPTPARFDFSDRDLVKVYHRAVICDRPTSWACRKGSWPIHPRKRPPPSAAAMSRRLRSPSVVALLGALGRRVTAPKAPGLYWMLDGKPPTVGGRSKDRRAGYGRAAGGKAKGYKIHAMAGADGPVACWRLAPMNKGGRVMAARLVKTAPPEAAGCLVGDADFDPNPPHAACEARGNLPLAAPRRYGPGRGTGHKKRTAGRPRSIALTGGPFPAFARGPLKDRSAVGRRFGNPTNRGGGRNGLPSWVRTRRRVRRRVQAKPVLTRLKDEAQSTTCAA